MKGRPKTYPFPVTDVELEHLDTFIRIIVQYDTLPVSAIQNQIQALSGPPYTTLFFTRQESQILRRILDAAASSVCMSEETMHSYDILNCKLSMFQVMTAYIEQEQR